MFFSSTFLKIYHSYFCTSNLRFSSCFFYNTIDHRSSQQKAMETAKVKENSLEA